MKIYKKRTAESYSFLVKNTNLPSNNPLNFRRNILERIYIIMTIDKMIRDERLQYNIKREAEKITALSSGKFDKYEYLTGKEILLSGPRQIIQQTKFTYSLLGKALEYQTNKTE